MQEKLKEYQSLILKWAEERDITCIAMQKLKLLEEVGELAGSIIKNNKKKQADSIGDIFVVLTILANQNNETFFTETETESNYFKEYDLQVLLNSILLAEYNIDFLLFLELCERLNLNILDCVFLAWNEIKDRKGKTVNGTFIKDEN